MMGDSSSLLQMADTVGLGDEVELIKALGALVGKWQELAEEIDSVGSALALVRAIADGTADADVEAAFEKVGAPDVLKTLKKGADRLKGLLDEVPEAVLRLLEPIGAFDERVSGTRDRGLIRWPLLGEAISSPAGAPAATEPSYSFSLGANAALTIEAGDTWPYRDPMPAALLRMRANGSLEAKGGATLPFSAGQVTASTSVAAGCALEYYFNVADQNSIYALAVGQRLPKLVNPFDFESVWAGFANSDLVGIHYEFTGSAALSVSVSVASTAALARDIKAELGATISVGFKLDGEYFLTFRSGGRGPDNQPRIIATLSRQRTRSADFGLKFGVTVDLSSLAQKVHATLAGALGEWDKVLKDLTPYLSPGTWLQGQADRLIQQQAAKLVKDKDLQKALVRDLQGVIGVGTPDESELEKWLTGQLTGALDAAGGWADARSATAIDSMVDNLGNAVPAFGQANIRAKLKDSAKTLVEAASRGLKDKVDDLFARDRATLGQALHRVGATSRQTVADANAALAGVRALIERYDALFRKVLEATQDAARAKVSAAVQIEESRSSGATVEIKGTFLAYTDKSRELFDALTRGDFNTLLHLIHSGAGADFDLDAAASSLRRYSGSTSKVGAELVLLGFGVSGSDLLRADADVIVDATGKVQVDTKASLKRRFKALDAEREIELISSFSLVAARVLAGAPPGIDRSLGLAVTIGHLDDGLKRHEVERFVGSLVDAGFIGEPALALAADTFTRWSGTPGSNGKLEGAMLFKLALDRMSLAQLLSLGEATISDQRARHIARCAFDNLREASKADRRLIDDATNFLSEKLPGRSLEDLLMDPRRTRKALSIDLTGTRIPELPNEARPFMNAVELSVGMREMVQHLRQIYFSTPEERSDDDPRTWGPRDYRDAERAAVAAVRGWLQLNTELFWTNSKVHPRTIAFLDTIAALSGLETAAVVSLTMSRRGENVSPETVVLF